MLSGRDQALGPLICGLVRHSTVKLAKVGDKTGRFRLNDSRYLLVKHASNSRSPWRFTFLPDDIQALLADQSRAGLFGNYLAWYAGRIRFACYEAMSGFVC